MLGTAQQIGQGEGQKRFVTVVGAIHARPAAALNQRAIRPRRMLGEGQGGSIHEADQVTLADRPIRGRAPAVDGQGGWKSHGKFLLC